MQEQVTSSLAGAAPLGQSDKPIGNADTNDSDLLKEVLNNIKDGREHRSQWRKDAREDFDFYAGKQWSDEDKRKLEDDRRVAVVFNRVIRAVNAVLGLEIQNRQEVTYIPRKVNSEVNQTQPDMQNPMMSPGAQPPFQMGQVPQQVMGAPVNDTGYSDMMNDIADWARDETNAEDEESESFENMVICGEGWTETHMAYDEDVEGMIVKENLDPLMVLVDKNSKKRNYEDAKWVAYIKDMTVKEVNTLYPDLLNPQYGAFWTDSDAMLTVDADENYKYLNDKSDQLSAENMVAVVQYQYFKKEPVYLVADPETSEVLQLDQKKFNKMKPMLELYGVNFTKVMKKVYYQCFVVGNQITEKMALGCDHFTIRAMTAFKDKTRNYFFGLISIMKDPQRWANKWLSQIQHILNSNSKGGVMVEEDAIDNIQKFEEQWALPDGVLQVRSGALSQGKIQPKEMAKYPDGIDRLLGYAINAINDVVGINLEMLGQANRDQAIGLEQLRREAGITILAKLFDSMRRYRKIDGRILAYFIQNYLSEGRLIRITGKNGLNYMPLIKSKIAFKYDIIVDESPTSPRAKERTFAQLQSLFPMLLQAGIPIPASVLDYSPFPDALVQEWKKEIEANSQPDPITQKLKELEVVQQQLYAMQQQADIAKTGADTQKSLADAEKAKSVGEEQSALAMQKFGVLNNQHELNAQEVAATQRRKDLELYLNQRRKDLELQIDTVLKSYGKVRTPSPLSVQ